MKQTVKPQEEAPIAPAAADDGDTQRVYAVPALEKGLDVMEFLAGQEQPVTLTGIAQTLGRSPSELFRVLSVLQRRGWIARAAGDTYRLSTRLFELATAYPPAKRLADIALPEMRALARELRQSCHLSVPDEGEILVSLSVEAPGPAGVFVRAGTRYPLGATASGRVMLAFGCEAGTPRRSPTPEGAERKAPPDVEARVARIRARGFEEVAGEWLAGVIDICWPIFDAHGDVAAVLAMPFLAVAPLRQEVDVARGRMRAAAEEITRAIGGGDYQNRLDAGGRRE
ncbi:IclR family transcriptional regulator [Alsobacter sp. SYSU M60028]|uniref:IclR family transcriptional regulator n=1 Tax=Alsobacter ponti TaxID=2962936 RepID=A0ABT1LBG3_9HYPH|nr:IclR family transcriptional regulator [Alsobacter ponti]MCP8937593.1 IclR family transcriptional regulator [Alsobacter ponti]